MLDDMRQTLENMKQQLRVETDIFTLPLLAQEIRRLEEDIAWEEKELTAERGG